jgi:hypothetical protein
MWSFVIITALAAQIHLTQVIHEDEKKVGLCAME